MTTAEGVQQTVPFALSVGEMHVTAPVGSDGYGYYAYDSTDTIYGAAPEYDWVDIAPPGPGNLARSDQFEVGLMHERRGEESMVFPLTGEPLLGGAQGPDLLGIDVARARRQGEQALERQIGRASSRERV